MAVTSVMRPSSSSAVTSRGLSGSAFLPLPEGPLKEIWSAASYGAADSGLPSLLQAVAPAVRASTIRVQERTVRVRGVWLMYVTLGRFVSSGALGNSYEGRILLHPAIEAPAKAGARTLLTECPGSR